MAMQLKFCVLPGRTAHPLDGYDSAYATFHSVWQETLQGIHGSGYVQHSNDFTRQDYVQALFAADGSCVALDCVREIGLGNAVDRKDSWLAPWPAEILNALAAEHTGAWINSYFTVHPAHRKMKCEDTHPISYILGCLSVLYQVELDVPLMLGMMRRDRSMNALGARLGAETLLTTTYHGVETDLVVFRKNAVVEASKKFPALALEIFERRHDHCEERRDEQCA